MNTSRDRDDTTITITTDYRQDNHSYNNVVALDRIPMHGDTVMRHSVQ